MLSTLNLFPNDFKSRQLIQIVAPILDKYTSESKNRKISVVRSDEDSDFIDFEYITKVNAVYNTTKVYILDTDYTVTLKNEKSILNWVGDKPDDDSLYTVDIDYYETCLTQDFEIEEPLLFKLLPDYQDKSAALSYFKTMIQPSIGTLFCINNLIDMIQVDAQIEEWFNTATIIPFHFNISIPNVPSIFDINAFIDYVFLLKNERSWLERVGQDICGDANVWDYFIYSDGLWDDIGGVDYRGVKVCIVDENKQKLFDDLPDSVSGFTWVDGQFEFYSPTKNAFVGTFTGDFDKLYEVESKFHFYYNLVPNQDMELDSDWFDYLRYAGLYPTTGLYPRTGLYPGSQNSSVTLNERSSLQSLYGTYSRRFKAILYGGINSNTFTTTETDLKIQAWVYPVNSTKVALTIIKDSDGSVVFEKVTEGLTLNTWNLVGAEAEDITVDTYRIGIYNSDIVDFGDTTEYEIFVDEVIVSDNLIM